jgi:hypothetical protein
MAQMEREVLDWMYMDSRDGVRRAITTYQLRSGTPRSAERSVGILKDVDSIVETTNRADGHL